MIMKAIRIMFPAKPTLHPVKRIPDPIKDYAAKRPDLERLMKDAGLLK
jgi:hypothetical protein